MSGNVTRTFDDVQTRLDEANARSITPTVDGVSAYIDSDATFVVVNTTDAGHWFYLPAAVNGKVLKLYIPTTGCEVRSAVLADKLNNVVVGATNQGALAPAVVYTCTYNSTTGNWVMVGETAVGAVQALVIPDAI